ncbi:hypothetical protein [Candidatus Protochlamydia phocaeensis]|uniref:hypothetical protein n=1 Tax=Candidatus Protochlamydia phocaeensis TaxID=1414722 RepID=UPI000A6447A5|nr:hypothetical protein [Candidatus Protochlamydia phocaeensis]
MNKRKTFKSSLNAYVDVDLRITEEEFRLIDPLKFDPSGSSEKRYDCLEDLAVRS